MSKQRTQLTALILIVIAVVAVVLFMFRDAVLPRAIGGTPVPPTAKIDIPSAEDYGALFARPDYQMLQRNGDVPVRPVGDTGNRDLFEPPRREGNE